MANVVVHFPHRLPEDELEARVFLEFGILYDLLTRFPTFYCITRKNIFTW